MPMSGLWWRGDAVTNCPEIALTARTHVRDWTGAVRILLNESCGSKH